MQRKFNFKYFFTTILQVTLSIMKKLGEHKFLSPKNIEQNSVASKLL